MHNCMLCKEVHPEPLFKASDSALQALQGSLTVFGTVCPSSNQGENVAELLACLTGGSTALCAVQLEDVLSWQCGHPQVRSMQTTSVSKEVGEASQDLQLDVLSNLERHVDRLSAFSDEEDEAELHNLYMVCLQCPYIHRTLHKSAQVIRHVSYHGNCKASHPDAAEPLPSMCSLLTWLG